MHPSLILFLLALALRLAWGLLTRNSVPVEDAAWYWSAAQRLFHEHAYTEAGRPTAYWPVGYAFFLSLFVPFGAWAKASIVVAQSLASAATVVFVHGLARTFARERAAFLVALGLALFPSAIALASSYLSETLFTFFLAGAFWCAWTRRGLWAAAVAGIAIGAACYVRPVALLLLPLLYGPMLSRGDRAGYAKRTVAACLIVAATALPWTIRNYKAFGGLCAYSTNLGVNLYIGHNPEADAGYVETGAMDSIPRLYPNELEASKRFQRMAMDYALAHPARDLRLTAVKAARLLGIERTNVYYGFITEPGGSYPRGARWLGLANNLYYGAWLLLFLIAPFRLDRGARKDFLWPAAAAAIQVLFYCLFFAADRYKFPAIPFIMLAAAAQRPFRAAGSPRAGSYPAAGYPR